MIKSFGEDESLTDYSKIQKKIVLTDKRERRR